MEQDFVDQVLRLCQGPGSPPTLSPEEFLAQVGEPDGTALALRTLRRAMSEHSALGVEMALILAAVAVFGVDDDFLEPLSTLVTEDWHTGHEDVVSLLDALRSPATVPALVAATQWVPTRLRWDDTHAFGRKAVYALARIGDREALDALARIADGNPWQPIASLASASLRERPDHFQS